MELQDTWKSYLLNKLYDRSMEVKHFALLGNYESPTKRRVRVIGRSRRRTDEVKGKLQFQQDWKKSFSMFRISKFQ